MADDQLDINSLAESTGLDPALLSQLLMMGGPASAPASQPQSLADTLAQTSMAVTGRRGITGKDFSGILPPWAAELAPTVLQNPDFDPYFGIVSEQGDERVFMGMKPPRSKKALEGYQVDAQTLIDPLVPGQPNTDKGVPEPTQKKPTVEEMVLNPLIPGAPNPDVDGEDDGWGGASWLDRAKEGEEATAEKEKVANPNDRTLTAAQVLNLPYTWDEDQIIDAMKRMRQAGMNVTSFDQLDQAWNALVNRASMVYSMSEGKRKVTPWDVLDMYKSEAKAAGSFTDYESGTKVSTNKSVANITEGEAWSSIQQTLSRMLGRDPSDQEVRDFTYRMNALAAANPAISKTITKYKAGEVTSSSTSTEGGFSAADMAKSAYEEAQSDPDYAEYQSGSTYFNAALSALGAIGDGG